MRPRLPSVACTSSRVLQRNLRSDWCAQVGAFSGFPPLLLAWLLAPSQARPFGRRLHRHLVEIGHLGMAGLNATETALHLVAVLQLPFGNPFLQSGKGPLDFHNKAAPDGLFFLLPPCRAAQDVGLFATRDGD